MGASHEAWQAEADLLADGREWVESQCRSRRLRYLYPDGPNLKILLDAYRRLEEQRSIRRWPRFGETDYRRKKEWRRFQRILRVSLAHDTRTRLHRLNQRYPASRPSKLQGPPPDLVRRALSHVDHDVAPYIESHILGQPAPNTDLIENADKRPPSSAIRRGLSQFRESLIHGALAQPSQLIRLHSQYLGFTASALPSVRKYPIAVFLLITLPFRLIAFTMALFVMAYFGAYLTFNDERLGDFLTESISGAIDGELAFESVHWNPWLIWDLCTGTPHKIDVYGVRVYEGFKREHLKKNKVTANANHLQVGLVLHEIIPWNRLGVPPVLEIPWILHFDGVRNRAEDTLWIRVSEYLSQEVDATGNALWKMSLTDAFMPADDSPSPPGFRSLSIQLEDAALQNLELELEMLPRGQWAAEMLFDEAQLQLDFVGSFPEDAEPERIPFRYGADLKRGRGQLHLEDQLNVPLALNEIDQLKLRSGLEDVALGDLWIEGQMRARSAQNPIAGPGSVQSSDLSVRGTLGHAMGDDPSLDLSFESSDGGALAQAWLAEAPDSDSVSVPERPLFSAEGSHLGIGFTGSIADPKIRIQTSAATLDFVESEPAWALDDCELDLRFHREALPPPFSKELANPQVDVDHDSLPWLIRLDEFNCAGLDGILSRPADSQTPSFVVLPHEDEDEHEGGPGDSSIRAALDLKLDGVNPAQFVPGDPSLADMLRGSSDGRITIPELVISENGDIERLRLQVKDFRVDRDHGPQQDNIPRQIRLSGSLNHEPGHGYDFRRLQIGVPGAEFKFSGHFDDAFSTAHNSDFSAEITEGGTFLGTWGLPPYFRSLSASLTSPGPLKLSQGKASGSLSLRGGRAGPLELGDIQRARLSIDGGVLRLHNPKVELLGGVGPLDIDFIFADNQAILSDPKLRVAVALENIDHRELLGSQLQATGAELQLYVDDGNFQPVKVSELQARGAAYVEVLRIANTTFRDVDSAFGLTLDHIRFDRLNLQYHQPFSPHLVPDLQIPLGQLSAKGTLAFSQAQEVDLDLRLRALPLKSLTDLLDLDYAVQGKILDGSHLKLQGPLANPAVDGEIQVSGLGLSDIPLGRGTIRFESREQITDEEPSRESRPYRQIQMRGRFRDTRLRANNKISQGEAALDWSLDGQLALGPARSSADTQVDVDLHANFHALPLANLLAHPERFQWSPYMEGQFNELGIHMKYCSDRGGALLSTCSDSQTVSSERIRDEERVSSEEPTPLQPLQINVQLEHFWLKTKDGEQRDSALAVQTSGDPCLDPSALCSTDPLVAELDGNRLHFLRPWKLQSGGKERATLVLDGELDFSPVAFQDQTTLCGLHENTRSALASSGSQSFMRGELDLGASESFLRPWGISTPRGKVAVELRLSGPVMDPSFEGSIDLPPDWQSISFQLHEPDRHDATPGLSKSGASNLLSAPVEFTELDFRIANGVLFASGAMKVFDELIRFGEVDSRRTYFNLSPSCNGRYAIAARGAIDGKNLKVLLPESIRASAGSIALDDFYVSGELLGEESNRAFSFIDRLDSTLSLGPRSLRVLTDTDPIVLSSGQIDVTQCTPTNPCLGEGGNRFSGGLSIEMGGPRTSLSVTKPKQALQLSIDESGRAGVWGKIRIDPSLSRISELRANLELSEFPFQLEDNTGRPELEADLSSPRIIVAADDGTPLRAEGELFAERSRWLRDASQGAARLSFADPVPPQPTQLPGLIRDAELDLKIRTTAPFRVDNNVLKQFEARADLDLRGTVGAPEVTGQIDIERGLIDFDILGGSYEIDQGRVILDHDLARSIVDIHAIKTEAIRVKNRLHTLAVHLSGALDSIKWECRSVGDLSAELGTVRGCVDYLLFDAGDTTSLESDDYLRGTGTGLIGTHFLPLAGRLTQVELDKVLGEQIPRGEEYIPYIALRMDKLGFVTEVSTQPSWMKWGWGQLGLGFDYLRGWPGSLLRDRMSVSSRLLILENLTLEISQGQRNYSNRVLILDPPDFRSFKLIRSVEIPSAR